MQYIYVIIACDITGGTVIHGKDRRNGVHRQVSSVLRLIALIRGFMFARKTSWLTLI